MAVAIATIADLKKATAVLEAAIAKDPTLETQIGKKLAIAVDNIYPKDGVTKDLQQAFTNGEKWWAVKVFSDETEGCTQDNKLEKIKDYIIKTAAYGRHFGNPDTKAKVEQWLASKFKDVPDTGNA